MQQQPRPQQRFVHALQSFDMNLAELHLGAGDDAIAKIEHRAVRQFVGHGRVHHRKRVAALLQGGLQAGAGREHIGGDRRFPGGETQRAAHLLRKLAVDIDAAQVIQRSQGKADRHLRIGA